MNIKIDCSLDLEKRRQEAWQKHGKVRNRTREFLKKFDNRVYLTGLAAIESEKKQTNL